MDVERIQKVNNLALDLMKQGLAQNKEDALSQAETIFRSQDSEDYNEIKDRMDEVKQETVKVEENKEDVVEELSQNKIKDILEQNSTFLVKKIREFQEKIVSLEKELAAIKSKMDYSRIPSAGEILTKEAAFTEEETKEFSQEGPPKLGEVTDNNEHVPKNHPKSGGFANEEVSIEKFFYMGDK